MCIVLQIYRHTFLKCDKRNSWRSILVAFFTSRKSKKRAKSLYWQQVSIGQYWLLMILTAVDANAQTELQVWSVADSKGVNSLQQSQRHAGDLTAVQFTVPHGQTWYHHIRIADGLHLGAPHKNTSLPLWKISALICTQCRYKIALRQYIKSAHWSNLKPFFFLLILYLLYLSCD